MIGFGRNEKTTVNLAAWISAFKIGFTLVSFFISIKFIIFLGIVIQRCEACLPQAGIS